jgi:hypothetical protein
MADGNSRRGGFWVGASLIVAAILIAVIYWTGSKSNTASSGTAPAPQTTGSDVNSRATTAPDTSSTGGR